MSMLTLIFVASFVSLAIVCTAIAWAIHARAELSAWRRTYRKLTEAENYAAWRNNRQMMMQQVLGGRAVARWIVAVEGED